MQIRHLIRELSCCRRAPLFLWSRSLQLRCCGRGVGFEHAKGEGIWNCALRLYIQMCYYAVGQRCSSFVAECKYGDYFGGYSRYLPSSYGLRGLEGCPLAICAYISCAAVQIFFQHERRRKSRLSGEQRATSTALRSRSRQRQQLQLCLA